MKWRLTLQPPVEEVIIEAPNMEEAIKKCNDEASSYLDSLEIYDCYNFPAEIKEAD
tara:strand:+ start:163 stop:330 length:168 start_codon:yes stop_codon:yes gene_type:complete